MKVNGWKFPEWCKRGAKIEVTLRGTVLHTMDNGWVWVKVKRESEHGETHNFPVRLGSLGKTWKRAAKKGTDMPSDSTKKQHAEHLELVFVAWAQQRQRDLEACAAERDRLERELAEAKRQPTVAPPASICDHGCKNTTFCPDSHVRVDERPAGEGDISGATATCDEMARSAWGKEGSGQVMGTTDQTPVERKDAALREWRREERAELDTAKRAVKDANRRAHDLRCATDQHKRDLLAAKAELADYKKAELADYKKAVAEKLHLMMQDVLTNEPSPQEGTPLVVSATEKSTVVEVLTHVRGTVSYSAILCESRAQAAAIADVLTSARMPATKEPTLGKRRP